MEDTSHDVAAPTLSLFDDRYGVGAHERLLRRFAQPCITFAQIASEFGVSRERVRQWHAALLPAAPSGLKRRRLCLLQQTRRRLLSDPLFRAFYRHARANFPPGAVTLIRTRDGLRARAARIQGRMVLIRSARHRVDNRRGGRSVYVLTPCRRQADFVYYHLDDSSFLFVPFDQLPASGTTFVDSMDSKYQVFRDNFASVTDAKARPPGGLTPTTRSTSHA